MFSVETKAAHTSSSTVYLCSVPAPARKSQLVSGVDLERGIFPVVKICNDEGMQDGSEADIEDAYRAVIAERRRGESQA